MKTALLADELVKGTQINVDSNNGVVTLSGAVDSPAHMQKAEQIAKGVSGVTRVQNNLNAPTTTTTSSTPPPSTMASSPATPAVEHDGRQERRGHDQALWAAAAWLLRVAMRP